MPTLADLPELRDGDGALDVEKVRSAWELLRRGAIRMSASEQVELERDLASAYRELGEDPPEQLEAREYADLMERLFASVPNFKLVTPEEKGKLRGLMAHYGKMAHPFTACVRDNTKRFGPERAKKVCAVLKDLIRGTTKWRSSERKMEEVEPLEGVTLEDVRDLAAMDLKAVIEAERQMAELETVDLPGVDILAAGGPYYGKGSPPEGDNYTAADLTLMVENTKAVADEVRAANKLEGGQNKLGHDPEQRLLRASGIGNDEMPSAGWLDLNSMRVDGGKIFVDIKGVPKKVAGLINSGAFRTRSVELKSIRSQRQGGKLYENVITGLAWLGAKAPAVRTLDDVVALYADQDDDDLERSVDYEGEEETAWVSEDGFRWYVDRLQSELGKDKVVLDIGGEQALVRDLSDKAIAWVVPYRFNEEDGSVEVAPEDEWELARPGWVQTATVSAKHHFADWERVSARSADTRRVPELTFNEEQVAKLAELTGVDVADIDPAKLMAALEETDDGEGDGDGDGKGDGNGDGDGEGDGKEAGRSMSEADLKQLMQRAERGDKAFEDRRVEKRDDFLQGAMDVGKFSPAKLADWQRRYDDNEEETRAILDEISEQDLTTVFGDDGDPEGETGESRLFAEHAAALGISEEERV